MSEWIPIKERMPEERVPVLVTFDRVPHDKEGDIVPIMAIGMRLNRGGDFAIQDVFCGFNFAYYMSYVKAWMPLPEPFKEAEE